MFRMGTASGPEKITDTVTGTILPAFETALGLLVMAGRKWSASGVLAEVMAAEAAVDVANGEVAVYGGYDTNDVRRWNAAFLATMTAIQAPLTVTLADGSTETTTIEAALLNEYKRYEQA